MANLIVNGFTVGTELQNVILTVNGGQSFQVNQLGHLKELQARQQTTPLTASPVIYNGKRLHRNIYHDFSGELMFTRFNNDLTALINGVVNKFQETGAETYFSIYGTVFNTTQGTVDEFLFSQCVVNDHDFGRFNGISEVDQSFAFRSQSLFLPGQNNDVLTQGATTSV